MVEMNLVIDTCFDDPRVNSGSSLKLGIGIYRNMVTGKLYPFW